MVLAELAEIGRIHPEEEAFWKTIAALNFYMGAVIVRTSKGGHKLRSFEELCRRYGLQCPIESCASSSVDEKHFNYTGVPDLTAALKTVQIAGSPDRLVQGVLGEMPASILETTYFVASDVIGGFQNHRTGEWFDANKFPETTSPDEIFAVLSQWIVGSSDEIFQARLSVGEAAYNPYCNRGVAGTVESFFNYKPLTPDELALYVFGYDAARKRRFDPETALEKIDVNALSEPERADLICGPMGNDLYCTNGGVRWEHPLFAGRIIGVNGVQVDSLEFEAELERLVCCMKGVSPYRFDLLRNAVQFAQSPHNSRGKLTSEVQRLADETAARVGRIPEAFKNVGSWEVWYPKVSI